MDAMDIDPDIAWKALAAHDARFDGRFFVGVTSTRIYCRPVCRVRTPRKENCRFYANAATAEQAGFRPCLRCRPELAPGLSLVDSSHVLAQHAARMIDHAVRAGAAVRMPDLAARLGVTERHLRRVFGEAHGVSPIDYLTTQRLLQAKQLLTDTELPVTEVALACGFESLRRFNAVFAEQVRLKPTELRKAAGAAGRGDAGGGPDVGLRMRLGYRPPLPAPLSAGEAAGAGAGDGVPFPPNGSASRSAMTATTAQTASALHPSREPPLRATTSGSAGLGGRGAAAGGAGISAGAVTGSEEGAGGGPAASIEATLVLRAVCPTRSASRSFRKALSMVCCACRS